VNHEFCIPGSYIHRQLSSLVYNVDSHLLLKPALEKLPKWLHSIFCSISSTAWTLIRPNAIIESRVLSGDIAIVSFHRSNRRDIRTWVDKVERAVHERRVRKASLYGLIDVQDIRMLIQRVRVQDSVVGILVDVARTIFCHSTE
jgi:hypothetical protein